MAMFPSGMGTLLSLTGDSTIGKNPSLSKKSDEADRGERIVCENRRARHDYEILETLECGMVLLGSEVRSLRDGNVSLDEAYAKLRPLSESETRTTRRGGMRKATFQPKTSETKSLPSPHETASAICRQNERRTTDASEADRKIKWKGSKKSKDRRAAERAKSGKAATVVRSVGTLGNTGELWLIGCDIAEYPEANILNHKPKRPRKLLLHRRELRKFAARAYEKGLTLIPLRIYFRRGRARLLLGLCRGKQLHDKRDAKKKAENDRYLARFTMKRT